MSSTRTPISKTVRVTLGLAVPLTVLALVAAGNLVAGGKGSWTQWGGPNQDFKAAATGLSQEWPEAGPPELWKRDLGEGYSAILVEDARLYTMYRNGQQDDIFQEELAGHDRKRRETTEALFPNRCGE